MARPISLVGVHQLGFEGLSQDEDVQDRIRQMIARALNTRQLIAFVGSGISCAYGYPSWDDLVKTAAKLTWASLKNSLPESDPRRRLLERYASDHEGARRVAEPYRLSPAERALVVLNLCDQLSAQAGFDLRERLTKFLKARKKGRNAAKEPDPLALIMTRLGIRRFLTTNYDLEIEHAFRRVLGCTVDGIADARSAPTAIEGTTASPRARSLWVDPSHPEVLVQFAVGAPGFERGVFHCHGVATKDDWRSMVLTESDYQRAYLHGDTTHRSYREALNTAFAANPILFVGVGMQEADLLRPLREFVSERQHETHERPLFALFPARRARDKRDGAEFREYLYVRFGVKVLYYDDDPHDRTVALCKAVNDLADRWTSWWMQWQEKPRIRAARFGRPDHATMIRHDIHRDSDFDGPEDIKAIRDALRDGAQGLVLVGAAGTGKGSLGARLVEDPGPRRYDRRFYATMHFTNELLSIIDGAADFFAEPRDASGLPSTVTPRPKDPIERLCHELRAGGHLLVVGGLERLLTHPPLATVEHGHRGRRRRGAHNRGPKTSRPAMSSALEETAQYPHPVGRPLTREVERLFDGVAKTLKAPETRSHVVFMSSLTPLGLDPAVFRIIRLRGTSIDTLTPREPFRDLKDEDVVRQLHHTLRGHAYALCVIERVLEAMASKPVCDRVAWLRHLVARLTALGLATRARFAVEHCAAWHRRGPQSRRRTRALILQRLALLATPVSVETLTRLCSHETKDAVRRAKDELIAQRLLLEVKGHPVSPRTSRRIPTRYTAHTVVRAHVLSTLGSLPDAPGEPHRFELAGFSIEAEDPVAGTLPGHKETLYAADRLIEGLEHPDTRSDDWHQRDLIRAAFGLIRSRWSATGISRLAHLPQETVLGRQRPHYDAYQRRLVRLLNIVRRVSADATWLNVPPDQEAGRAIHEHGLLYADELAWLYNEIGMVAYCQGFLYDAYALFRLVQHIVAVAEHGSAGHRWCESELSMALVQLDRARLPRARYHLENALRQARNLHDRDIAARARGYLGLVQHLSGNAEHALHLYNLAVKRLQRTENQRGLSIFLRHRADLQRTLGHSDEAWCDIQASIRAAENGRHVDLIQYTRVAEAHLRLSQTDVTPTAPGAQEVLGPALDCARRLGLPKLTADVYKVQGHIALHHGETELAERLARLSLRLASALGMRLRVTSAMVFLGRIARRRGNRQAADDLLRSAIDMAQRQGYHLQVEAAERELMSLAGPPQMAV